MELSNSNGIPSALLQVLNIVGVDKLDTPVWSLKQTGDRVYLDILWHVKQPFKSPGNANANGRHTAGTSNSVEGEAQAETNTSKPTRKKRKSPSTLRRNRGRLEAWREKHSQLSKTTNTSGSSKAPAGGGQSCAEIPASNNTHSQVDLEAAQSDTPQAEIFRTPGDINRQPPGTSETLPPVTDPDEGDTDLDKGDTDLDEGDTDLDEGDTEPQYSFSESEALLERYALLADTRRFTKEDDCMRCYGSSGYGTSELKKCTRCQVARYCSKQCQKADWEEHRLVCKPDLEEEILKWTESKENAWAMDPSLVYHQY
jgi:hypothetical protein